MSSVLRILKDSTNKQKQIQKYVGFLFLISNFIRPDTVCEWKHLFITHESCLLHSNYTEHYDFKTTLTYHKFILVIF